MTIYEATQGVVNHRNVLAQMLGIPRENVRVVSKFLGSGFGGKLFPWSHCALAAVAARNLSKPSKAGTIAANDVPNRRPSSADRAAHPHRRDARGQAAVLPARLHQPHLDPRRLQGELRRGNAVHVQRAEPAGHVIAGAAERRHAHLDARSGAVPGLFATESAMDELAIKLKMDPVTAPAAQRAGRSTSRQSLPFSSRHIKECFETGAEKFGWSKRTAEVGSMKHDGLTIGWGMAGCSWIAARFNFNASVELRDDGTACVSSATQDIGTGTYTVMAQMASERLGLPVEKIEVILGDTRLPSGSISGGSMVTASAIPAILQAADAAVESLLGTATKDAQVEVQRSKARRAAIHERSHPS